MTVRWAGGGRHELEIPWLRVHRTHAEVIQLVKEMAPTHSDNGIAETLNSMGYRRRYGQREFTASSVRSLRREQKIPNTCPDTYREGDSGPRGDGRYCVRDLAEMIGCSKALVSELCKAGKLDATRSTSRSPWWIKIDENQIRAITQRIPSRRKGAVSRFLSQTFAFAGEEGIIET